MRYDPFWHKPPSQGAADPALTFFILWAVLVVYMTSLVVLPPLARFGASMLIVLGGAQCILVARRLRMRQVERWWRAQLASKKLADEFVSQLSESPALARDIYEKLGTALAKGLPSERPR